MPSTRHRTIYLTDDGIIGGTSSAAVNGAITPAPYWFQPSLNSMTVLEVHRMLITIEDAGAIAADSYGVISALANGVNVQHISGGVTVDLTGGIAISNVLGWARLCHDLSEHTFGAGNNFVTVRWTFARHGEPLLLEGTDQLKVTINDDLTGLVDHHFVIQGLERTS